MRKKTGNALLAFAAAAMVLTVNGGSARAYFTTYVEAQGGAVVHLGGETQITENVSSWTKHISIQNTEGEPVYVRVKAFCGDAYALQYSDPGNMWLRLGAANTDQNAADDDVFYLYKNIVYPGENNATSELQIKIDTKGNENTFDVVVIYESIPVQYDENGEILKPVDDDGKENSKIEWDQKLESIETKPSGEVSVTPGQSQNPDEPSTPATNPDVPPEPSESTEQSQEPSGAEQESGTEQDTESDNGGEG